MLMQNGEQRRSYLYVRVIRTDAAPLFIEHAFTYLSGLPYDSVYNGWCAM
jgi:hypothetical protein